MFKSSLGIKTKRDRLVSFSNENPNQDVNRNNNSMHCDPPLKIPSHPCMKWVSIDSFSCFVYVLLLCLVPLSPFSLLALSSFVISSTFPLVLLFSDISSRCNRICTLPCLLFSFVFVLFPHSFSFLALFMLFFSHLTLCSTSCFCTIILSISFNYIM